MNRVGKDGMGIEYRGDSMLIDAKGHEIASLEPDKMDLQVIQLSMSELSSFRAKFPAWKDADSFILDD